MFPEEVPLEKTGIGFVQSYDDIQEFFRWLGQKRDVLALDTETAGLNPYASDARIRLFQCGDVNSAWVIDAVRWPGIMFEVLEKYQGPMVWHNIAFDAGYIRVRHPDLKFPWSKSHDTMLMARLFDNEASAGLKPLSEKLWGRKATIGQELLKQTMENTGTDWNTVPLDAPAYRTYSGVDVILTARMYRHFNDVHSGSMRQPYEVEMQARRICSQMEYRGMRIDTEYCSEKAAQLNKYVEDAIEYAQGKWGVKLGSTKDLGVWFTGQGADILETTGTGQPKMDEDSLTHLINQGYELADLALKARKATKIKSTYLDNFILFGEHSGGIVHPQINTMAAKTGRMSITNPALQTLPRDDKTVRPSIIPHEGDVLISSDLDQVEMRLAGALSHDSRIIEDFRVADTTGPDFFTSSGRTIYSDPEMVKSDPRRATVKTYWYSSLYGAGVRKQAVAAGVPVETMQRLAADVRSAYTELEAFKKKVVSTCETMARDGQRPYVTTYTGRRLYVPTDRTYVAVNYLIQSTAAEVFKYNLIDLSMSGLDEYLVCPVHDEILLSAPKDEVDDIVPIVNECMTTSDFDIPLPGECGEPMDRWVKQ